eukprot:5635836-Pleurochrysis_carterae.AAC.4
MRSNKTTWNKFWSETNLLKPVSCSRSPAVLRAAAIAESPALSVPGCRLRATCGEARDDESGRDATSTSRLTVLQSTAISHDEMIVKCLYHHAGGVPFCDADT